MMLIVVLCVLMTRGYCDITQHVGIMTISQLNTNDTVCPDISNTSHAVWSKSVTDGVIRCELKCDEGYEPDKCNVLMEKGNGTWDRDIPNCVNEPWAHGLVGKIVLSLVAGVGAVIVIHVLLCCVGFTPCGVRKRSLAACCQDPYTEPESLFAHSQRAGVKGCPWPVSVVLFVAASAATCVTLFVLLGKYC